MLHLLPFGAEVAQALTGQVQNRHTGQLVEAGVQVLQLRACCQSGQGCEPVALQQDGAKLPAGRLALH